MKEMESNSIDFIVTDPPYGLNFMGKDWDKDIPGIDIWSEALRICKPGSMLAAFGGTRTHHHLMIALEKAGWEIRDCMMWLYGSGFPKSHNKFELDGYGTALKPAWEPIIIAMKPIYATFKKNVEKWGIGGINIDDCRIITNENIFSHSNGKKTAYDGNCFNKSNTRTNRHQTEGQKIGRWPANLIFDEASAEMLDSTTSHLLGAGNIKPMKQTKTSSIFLGKNNNDGVNPNYYGNKEGSASRFFYCAKASIKEKNEGLEEMPIRQTKGGGGLNNTDDDVCGKYGSIKAPQQNIHPTVKPLSLMRYIIKLLAPPNDPLLLDPFCGSGSTLIAAKQLGIKSIGIELNEEYCEIAKTRLSSCREQISEMCQKNIDNDDLEKK